MSEVRTQDLMTARASWRATARPDATEDSLDVGWRAEIAEATGRPAVKIRCWSCGAVVEEIDVNSVSVMRRADWRDDAYGLGNFRPGAATHGSRVIDEKDGIKGGEKSIGILRRRGLYDGSGR